MVPVIMPQIGQDITKGLIVEWLIEENEEVVEGEILMIVESEKASFDIEAPKSGILIKQLYTAGEEAEVLKPVGYIGISGEKYKETDLQDPVQDRKTKLSDAADSSVRPDSTEKPKGKKLRASPAAKDKARMLGVALNTIRGSGPGGRIIKKDVLKKISQEVLKIPQQDLIPALEEGDREEFFSSVRQIIAGKLVRSKQQIPHFYLALDVEMDSAETWRQEMNKHNENPITVNDIIIYNVAAVLEEFPRLNSIVAPDRIVIKKEIKLGIAVATNKGLMVPVLPDARKKTVTEISRSIKTLAEEARTGGVKPGSQCGFTISSLGMYGIREFYPIINPPECAILGVGKMEDRVVADKGQIVIRKLVTLSLSCDHRAIDGDYAAGFLKRIKENLELHGKKDGDIQ